MPWAVCIFLFTVYIWLLQTAVLPVASVFLLKFRLGFLHSAVGTLEDVRHFQIVENIFRHADGGGVAFPGFP